VCQDLNKDDIKDQQSSGMTTETPHHSEQPWDGCVIAFDVCPANGNNNLTTADLRKALESTTLSKEDNDWVFVNSVTVSPQEEWGKEGPFKCNQEP